MNFPSPNPGPSRRSILIASAVLAVLAETGCTIQTPKSSQHGKPEIVGDGITDDAPALQALILRTAHEGSELTLPAHATLRLGSGIVLPSGTHLDGNGSTLVNDAPGDGTSLLTATKSRNVMLKNLVLDGNRLSYVRKTEQRHNIRLSGAHEVTLDNIQSRRAKGDGLYVGDQNNGPSTKVRAIDSVFEHNYRQGMSITSCSDVALTRCTFSDTSGTAPAAGVDIEPNTDDAWIEGVVFDTCSFLRNQGGGLLIALRPKPQGRQSGGEYINCIFDDNPLSNGIMLFRARDTRFEGGHADNNGLSGVRIGADASADTYAIGITFSGMSIASSVQSGALITGSYRNLGFHSCAFVGNGVHTSASFGIDSSPSGAAKGTGLSITKCSFTNMRGGIRLNDSNVAVDIAGNAFSSTQVTTVQ